MMEIRKEAVFKLGQCEVNPSDNSLCFFNSGVDGVSSEKVSIQPKFIEVLSYLARQYPEVVTREELIDNIWEGNSYVGSKALTNAIWHLRKHLNQEVGGDNAIETVRKMGYRLLIEPCFNQSDLVDDLDLFEQSQLKIAQLTSLNRRIAAVGALALLFMFSAWTYHLYQDSIRYVPTLKQSLTTAAGSELYPIVSPDGRWLVYGSRSNNRYSSLYLKDLTKPTETPKRLTSTKTAEIRAVWSPDGEALYFGSEHRSEGKCYLTKLNLDSNEALKLGECYTYSSALDIAPDSSRLVYIWDAGEGYGSGLYELSLTEEALPKRLSCAEHCSYRDRDLAFSPDGRWLAIARRFGNISEDIFILNTKTAEERRLTFGLEDIRGLSWHQDNERLIFSTENSGVRNGFIVGINDKHILPLDVEGMSYPRSIPNTDELVYSNYMRDYQVASFALEQSIPTATFPLLQVDYSYRNPDYSAITQRIVYVSNETGFNEIWTSDINGENRRQHTDLKRRVAYPSWSHDGTKIAFLAPDDKNEGNKIHVLDLSTSNISILATPYLDHNRPSWGWNDEMVLSRSKDGITEFYLDNRLPKVINSMNMRLGKMISEDKLVFTRLDRAGLWVVALSEPDNVTEVISEHHFGEGYNWVATDKGIYFRNTRRGFQLINFWRFNTGLITPILKLPSGSIPRSGAMTYIANNNSLLMTLSQNYKRDVIKLQHRLLH